MSLVSSLSFSLPSIPSLKLFSSICMKQQVIPGSLCEKEKSQAFSFSALMQLSNLWEKACGSALKFPHTLPAVLGLDFCTLITGYFAPQLESSYQDSAGFGTFVLCYRVQDIRGKKDVKFMD